MFPPKEPSLPEYSTVEPLPSDHWLDLFRRQVRQYPDRTAVITSDLATSYETLDQHSDRIAEILAEAGIGAGHYVGCGFERSEKLIAALLGIMKSGAAYVPLDPGYPPARIAQMVDSAGLQTVVTSAQFAPSFPGVRVLDPEDSPLLGSRSQHPHPTRSSDNPVYAIFTSGSTGQPKAASVFDSGFANLLDWYSTELELGPDDRTLVISSPSFDLTQKNLFAPLLTGGTLVLDDCQTYDITRILGLLRRHQITLINCTPSAFYPLVDAAAADGFAALESLRFAVLGGEPISMPRLRAWLEQPSSRAEVVNSYGPTECTDICLFHRMHRGNLDAFPVVPLGREIPNVQVTIRDEHLAILRDGEIGELCIGGAGVGGGYLDDPVKTAGRFIDGIYRTGDLARRLPCGTFEFHGRADQQVKVNGFRIELGDIEIALNGHDKVREAIVTASGDRLKAHVVGSATAAELREHLVAKLPAYMIPTEFLSLAAFPLTPNGKADRKALAQQAAEQPPAGTDPNAQDLESSILTLLSELLGHPVSDASSNFFDLGGSSIHLAVLHVRLRDLTGRDFPITDLFANPTARAVATHLSPRKTTEVAAHARARARLAKAGLARFPRPLKR